MSGANTVIDLKSAFIRRQTRILSQPLQAPQQWKDDCNIPDAAVRSAMREVNRRLVRHNKTVYPSVSIRHTAEMIDNLYWQRSAPRPSAAPLDAPPPSASHAVDADPFHPSADLAAPTTIAALPRSWADVDDDDDQARALLPASASASSTSKPHRQNQLTQAYTTRATTLHALSARRAALRRQLARYKALRAALAPLAQPERNVQPNLATRDGALAGEMARLRALSVRVAARVGARREEGDAGNEGKKGVEKGEEEGEDVLVGYSETAERERERRKLGRVMEW